MYNSKTYYISSHPTNIFLYVTDVIFSISLLKNYEESDSKLQTEWKLKASKIIYDMYEYCRVI